MSKKKECGFCKKSDSFIPLTEATEYSGIEIAICGKGMLRARYYAEGTCNFDGQDVVNINFCPICGRRLGG